MLASQGPVVSKPFINAYVHKQKVMNLGKDPNMHDTWITIICIKNCVCLELIEPVVQIASHRLSGQISPFLLG